MFTVEKTTHEPASFTAETSRKLKKPPFPTRPVFAPVGRVTFDTTAKLRWSIYLRILVAIALWLGVVDTSSSLEAQACAPNCWTVSGSVFGPNLEPIVGLDVDLLYDGTVTEILLSGDVTSTDGSFSFTIQELIPSGFYTLQLNPPADSPYFPMVTQNLFLSGTTTMPTDFVLEPASFFSGEVVDQAGQGIPDIDLNFYLAGTATEVAFSGDVTAADGAFMIRVTPNVYDIEFRTTLTTPGGPFVPVLLRGRPLLMDLDVGEVLLRSGHPLVGVIEDESGNPVESADIDVRDPLTEEVIETSSDNSDANGSFSILVPTGEWLIEVDPPLGSSLVSRVFTIQVFPGPNDAGTLSLESGVEFSGMTSTNQAQPVPEVDLDFIDSLTSIEIPTVHDNADSNGNFAVQIPIGTYDVQFRPPFQSGLAPHQLESVVVTADTAIGSVIMSPGTALTGTVTGNGAPAEGVEVALVDTNTGEQVYTFGNDTDALGMFGIRQLPGVYDVTFYPPQNSMFLPVTVFAIDLNSDISLNTDLPTSGPMDQFVRGDVDDSGVVDLADAIFVLSYLFGGSSTPRCADAADVNNSGMINIADVIHLLSYLFVAGAPEPAAPFPTSGTDHGPDNLPECM